MAWTQIEGSALSQNYPCCFSPITACVHKLKLFALLSVCMVAMIMYIVSISVMCFVVQWSGVQFGQKCWCYVYMALCTCTMLCSTDLVLFVVGLLACLLLLLCEHDYSGSPHERLLDPCLRTASKKKTSSPSHFQVSEHLTKDCPTLTPSLPSMHEGHTQDCKRSNLKSFHFQREEGFASKCT